VELVSRSYSVELSVEAGGKQRHLLTKLIRTDRKVRISGLIQFMASNDLCMAGVFLIVQ
jgi:hypothetical protein